MESYEVLLGILFWIAVIYYIKNRKKDNYISDYKEIDNKNNKTQYKKMYYRYEKLLTPNEILFYKTLKEILKDKDIIINSQVVLYEIIGTKTFNKYAYKYFNKIKAKSIDFVLTDKDFNILLCIELDDSTHKRVDRIKRDNFINELFQELEIKLLRLPVQEFYSIERIDKILKESL